MKKYLYWIVAVVIIFLAYGFLSTADVLARPFAQSAAPTPSQVIDGINTLRLSYGIAPLSAHPILMQVGQLEANGIASGGEGHWRPEGLTLGQWLISLGYPLSGDLSMDGYRSENWGFAQDAESAIAMWLLDDLHENTMLSLDRSDIGVGIASMGDGSYVIVVETALQTNSGQQQSEAYVILTGIPLTQAAYSSMSTQAAENGLLPQNVAPVFLNTALPNGDVYHDVKYGQTLWSIAISYRTTIKQIQQLNQLTDTMVQTGQHLLVLKGATQSAPASAIGTVALPPTALSTPTVSFAKTATPESTRRNAYKAQDMQKNKFSIIAIGIAALFLGGLFTVMTRKKPI